MKPPRLKLKHEYHDGSVLSVDVSKDLSLKVALCDPLNPFEVHLTFTDLRYGGELRSQLKAGDEILSVRPHEERGYRLDLVKAGTLRIDARGVLET